MTGPERRITGYPDRLSVQPGGRVRFHLSTTRPGAAEVAIVRILAGDDPGGPGFREEVVAVPATPGGGGRLELSRQPVRPGSFALVPRGTPPGWGEAGGGGLTLRAVVQPTTPFKGLQAVCGIWDAGQGTGLALAIAPDGSGAVLAGNGSGGGGGHLVATGVPLSDVDWTELVATWEPATGRLAIAQHPLPAGPGGRTALRPARAHATLEGESVRLPPLPLLLAAWIEALEEGALEEWGPQGWRAPPPGLRTGGHFNGRIGDVRLLSRALGEDERPLLDALEPPPALLPRVLGWWDPGLGIAGERLLDRGPGGRHGWTVALPTRGVAGHRWDGTVHRYAEAPEHYAAIHFHDDDLVDVQWPPAFDWEVPPDLPSGVYAARVREPAAPEEAEHVVFFVRPRPGEAGSDVALLVPTASYLAYGNYRLRLRPNPIFGAGEPEHPNDVYLKQHPELGGSLYDRHSDWSGVHHVSRLRPLLNLRPRHNRIWGFPADCNLLAWLAHEGIPFDVVTDEDLHREGAALLRPYRVVLTGSHPEYHSTAMLDALETWLGEGGRLMYLGGNGFYWRIAWHPEEPAVIEVRRAEDGTRAWMSPPGEYWHAFNGEYGGLWRRIGRPPNRLVGVGFAAQGFEGSSYYRRAPGAEDPRAAFVFRGVPEEIIGDFGSLGGGAAGEEIDRYDRRLGSPPHALVLASSEGHDAAMLRTKEELLSTMPPYRDPKVRADLVFFECPEGGAVFSTGSIAWCGALAHGDYRNPVARITANVLARFRDPEPFVWPPDGPGDGGEEPGGDPRC